MSLVHHYTTGRHLPLILANGYLRPSNAGALHEPPLLWFSRNQHWEATATKIARFHDGLRLLTFDEQLQLFGCVRFSLSVDYPFLMTWEEACEHAGISKAKRLKLEETGRERGGTPSDWLALSEPLSIAGMRLQRFDGASWVDLNGIEGSRP